MTKKLVLLPLLLIATVVFAAVTNTVPRRDTTGDGSTTAFTFSFPAQKTTDIEVYLNFVKQTSGYTVSLYAAPSVGGTVTFSTAPGAAVPIRIQRAVPKTQETVYTPYSAFPAKTTEKALDRIVMQGQEIDRRVADAEAKHATDESARVAQRTADLAAQVSRDSGQDTAIASAGTGIATGDSMFIADGGTVGRSLKAHAADTVKVKNYATCNGVTDETTQIQDAIDVAITRKAELEFPDGTCLVSGQLDFTSIAVVANGTPFGLVIRGQGMGTVIKTTAAAGVLFQFDAGALADLNVRMSGIQAYSTTGGVIGLNLGKLSRYSEFNGVRLVGFKEGIRFHRETYSVVFRDLYIRHSAEEAIAVDTADLGTGVLTETKFFGGYIDNNGTATGDGAAYVPTMYLRNVQEWKFYGTVIEGNNSGGIQIEGTSHNIVFHGVRFEETFQRWGASGHIHNFGATTYNVNFYDCEFAYDKNGLVAGAPGAGDGGKSYQLMLIPAGAGPVRIINSQILDMSDTVPTDVFGASPATALIEVDGLLNGNGVGAHTVSIPARYLGRAVGTGADTKRHSYGSAAPVSGTWYAGDVVWATDPASVKAIGWVNAVNGTPGTWRTVRATHENASAPGAGTWARGDIVWNNSPDPGEPVGWLCTVAGTPGTWVAIPGPGVTQADSVAADVAALKTDFNSLLAKMRSTGVLAP